MAPVSAKTKKAVSSAAGPEPRRRTQAQRTRAMRKRLIIATLEELADSGYANLSLNAVVTRAGVSRGAQVHHFPNKNILILESAKYLLRRAYRSLGEVLLSISDEDERISALLNAAWEEVFSTPMFNAFFELVQASQHDPELNTELRKLGDMALRDVQGPVEHYFVKRSPSSLDPTDLFVMLTLGLASMGTVHRMSGDPNRARHYLDAWIRLFHSQLRVRKNVRKPPARPPGWVSE